MMLRFPTLLSRLAAGAALLLALAACEKRAEPEIPVSRTHAWPETVVEQFASLPIQHEGRIKPIENYASYLLLRLNGKRSVNVTEEVDPRKKLKPVPWLLDVMFYPEQADHYPVFLVADSEVVRAIGLDPEAKRKRDRYSCAELRPAARKLNELAQKYHKLKDRTRVQNQVLRLWVAFRDYSMASSYLGFADIDVPIGESKLLAEALGEGETAPFSKVLAAGSDLYAKWQKLSHGGAELVGISEAEADKERAALRDALVDLQGGAERAVGIDLFAPVSNEAEEWSSLGELVRERQVEDEHVAQVARLEAMVEARGDPERFAAAMAEFHGAATARATARGEYESIPTELLYLRADFFYWSLVLYVLGFLVVAFGWLFPRTRWLYPAAIVTAVVPTAVLIAGIVTRCSIQDRPPITGIWDTIPYITGTAVIGALLMEWINRKRIALPLASILGMLGMFLALKHEEMVGEDTMKMLVAVLDSNYWLIVHVLSINLGYSAPLLAAGLAHVYVLGKLFGWRKNDRAFYKNIVRMVYGALCFGLLFSVVGTILGGVWANDSWGRFWGWDPKENGALMICLWLIALLHARMGGYVRDFGICIASILGGTVVAFSWWHVNMLGVGLHSYGATEGKDVLWAFYWTQWFMGGLGMVLAYRERVHHEADAAARRAARAEADAMTQPEPEAT